MSIFLIIWLTSDNNDETCSHSQKITTTVVDQENIPDTEGIQLAVNEYCTQLGVRLGEAYGVGGSNGMNSGYIISERFPEEMLSDSPSLLRLKQVGNAAAATIDCEVNGQQAGIVIICCLSEKAIRGLTLTKFKTPLLRGFYVQS